jgi:hypothetical protein
MKKIFGLFCLAATLCVATQAQNTLTAWTFDNVPIGINSSPAPSTDSSGFSKAVALGMNNSYNSTNSISNPDVLSLAGSSSGGPNSWRIRGFSSIAGSHGNGWSTNAPVGTQGAQFSGSTFGYYKVKVSFDVYATSDAEANLQVQFSTDGSTWNNATITSGGTSAGVFNNNADPNTVIGSYVKLNSGWNNQIVVDLSGFAGVENNTNFAVRLVNASTGASCVDTTGAVYNNTSGSWSFDNVVIQGSSIDVIADWSFDVVGTQGAPDNSPAPTTGSGVARVLGMTNTYTFASGPSQSFAWADVTATGSPYPSTGNDSYGWRVRGGTTGAGVNNSGWNTAAPIGAQGAEFDADTSGYSNIVCSFNLYFTTQAEAKMCAFYTTNGWASSNVANTLFYGGDPGFMVTNTSSANTVNGTYFFNTNGSAFYDCIVVDFTGVPGVDNNPNFGFRVVNAATGADCINYLNQKYNNSSGNWRYDNVIIGGTAGSPAPTINYDPNATVDGPFTNTFVDNPSWRANIYGVYINGALLTNTAYNITVAGQIIFTPSKSTLLQASGLDNILILAHGFGSGRVVQPVGAGVATQLAITTQAVGPSASGGTLAENPVLQVSDQYGNSTTNPYPNVSITASAGGIGGWTLGGATTQSSVNGVVAFTNLSATVNGLSAVSNAFITFTVSGYTPVSITNSSLFNIGVPPVPFTPGNLAVVQIDTLDNNTTFSVVEINPSQAGQTAPVNVVPISATGTGALRLSSSGSTGRLALSDDGTLLTFAAFVDGSAATPDETLNLNRAAASMNWSNQVAIGVNYTSVSLGGSQARAACILSGDAVTPGQWIVDDKGGLYEGNTNSGIMDSPNLNVFNSVVVRTFGGTPYVETQKAVAGQNIPVVYTLVYDPDTGLYDVTVVNNLATDPAASDFYLVSNGGGTPYGVLYIADQNSATNGVIKKYSLVSGNWAANGSFTNSTGVDGLFATTNGNGGVYLFYTTGAGGTGSNSVVRVTDGTGWNQNISIVSSNVIYTTSAKTSLEGLTFVPQLATNAPELVPPPVLTAQNGVIAGTPFNVTTAPEVPSWRSAITSITVNGSLLPPAAYDTTQSGKIVFNSAQSALLQSPGLKTIVVNATGFSQDSVLQNLSYIQSVLTGVTLTGGNMTFSFTNATGLSFSVLGTNNLAAPKATWPVVGGAVENPPGSGHYQFTAPYPATNSAQFYILRQP